MRLNALSCRSGASPAPSSSRSSRTFPPCAPHWRVVIGAGYPLRARVCGPLSDFRRCLRVAGPAIQCLPRPMRSSQRSFLRRRAGLLRPVRPATERQSARRLTFSPAMRSESAPTLRSARRGCSYVFLCGNRPRHHARRCRCRRRARRMAAARRCRQHPIPRCPRCRRRLPSGYVPSPGKRPTLPQCSRAAMKTCGPACLQLNSKGDCCERAV